jgi:hypothetical protein
LLAWELPALMREAQERALTGPAGSLVAPAQWSLFASTMRVLDAIADDARNGLRETLGIECRLATGEKAAIALDLPPGIDPRTVAAAIDRENIEAWCKNGHVHVAIGPWYTTQDIDYVVLSITKVLQFLISAATLVHAAASRRPAFSSRG